MIPLAFLFHFLSFYEHPKNHTHKRETMSPYATTEKLLMRGTFACQSMDTQGKGGKNLYIDAPCDKGNSATDFFTSNGIDADRLSPINNDHADAANISSSTGVSCAYGDVWDVGGQFDVSWADTTESRPPSDAALCNMFNATEYAVHITLTSLHGDSDPSVKRDADANGMSLTHQTAVNQGTRILEVLQRNGIHGWTLRGCHVYASKATDRRVTMYNISFLRGVCTTTRNEIEVGQCFALLHASKEKGCLISFDGNKDFLSDIKSLGAFNSSLRDKIRFNHHVSPSRACQLEELHGPDMQCGYSSVPNVFWECADNQYASVWYYSSSPKMLSNAALLSAARVASKVLFVTMGVAAGGARDFLVNGEPAKGSIGGICCALRTAFDVGEQIQTMLNLKQDKKIWKCTSYQPYYANANDKYMTRYNLLFTCMDKIEECQNISVRKCGTGGWGLEFGHLGVHSGELSMRTTRSPRVVLPGICKSKRCQTPGCFLKDKHNTAHSFEISLRDGRPSRLLPY